MAFNLRFGRYSCALSLALVLFACKGLAATRIREIVDDPRSFDGAEVTVAGSVGESANLWIVRSFTVRDETGEILVVTERAVPKSGSSVRVTGQIKQAFALGEHSLLVLIEGP